MEGKQASATKGCAPAGSGEEDILSGLYCERVTVKCVRRRKALRE
jgi:hypothetical protein